MELHKDVINTAIDSQIQRLVDGESLPALEIAELILVIQRAGALELDKMSKTALEFGHNMLDKQQTIRVYDTFLTNHGLEEEFENYYHRIMRRRFKEKKVKP